MQKLSALKAKAFIIADLKTLGFDDVRILDVAECTDLTAKLDQFVASNFHGSMEWMKETLERRSHPQKLWHEAQSIIMVAMRYGPDESYDPLAALEKKSAGTISCYALNRDYHDVMKGKLKQAAGRLAAKTGAQVKIFVDTAPVMEKPLAQQSGLGWQGKHTNLVSRQSGSWFFLGSIFTDMILPPDAPEIDHCGSCRSCLDICPTDAFPAPYQLDARKCISYLTIEHAGPIEHKFRKAMGNRIYGCDDCLAICPWNKFASAASEAKLVARDALKSPKLGDLLQLDDVAFRSYFSGSPIKRIGRNRFIRNCLIAAGNSGDFQLLPSIEMHIADKDSVVRGAAVWALTQLLSADEFHKTYQTHYATEMDETVRDEWQRAIDG